MRTLPLLLPVLLAAPAVARADAEACKAGALAFGNPVYRGSDRPNPKGQTVRQDPPLEWRGLAFNKGNVFTMSGQGQELWGGDVAGAIKLIAGERQAGASRFADGPCNEARFTDVRGIAALRDGTVVLADWKAHAIRLVRDPLGACTVETIVGAHAPFAETDFKAPAPGDVDGAAKDAKIGGPAWLTVDGSGTIFFVDTAAKKVKEVGTDEARTVTTLATLDPKLATYTGLTLLDDKLYVIGNSSGSSAIVEVDPATKKSRTIREGGDKLFPPLSAHAPALSSITNDGTALLVTGQGYIWRVTKDGKGLTLVGGIGFELDYPKGYNPAGVYPLKQLFLRFRNDEAATAGTSTAMVWNSNVLYWRGKNDSAYVLKIGCP